MYNAATQRRIAVIGGGISGLAAALRIRELDPSVDVTLLEASDRLGGVLQTESIDGFLVERGPDNFITNIPAAVALCRSIGFEDQLLDTNPEHRRALVVHGGELHPVPEGFTLMSPKKLWPMMTTPILSWRGKLRLLLEFFISAKSSPQEESLADFARRRLGREVYERLVEPLIAGIYTADAEELSVAAALPQFVEMERKHGGLIRAAWAESQKKKKKGAGSTDSGARYSMFMAPREGMSQWVEALAKCLPDRTVRLETAVRSISKSHRGGWSVELESASKKSKPLAVDGVLLATPAHAAAKIVHEADSILADELNGILHAGSAVICLGYRRDQIAHPLDAFGFVVPAAEGRQILAGSFSSIKYPGRAPEDHVLIRVFAGGATHPRLAEAEDGELRDTATRELDKLLKITGEPVLCEINRWPQAMPQYHLGHLDRVNKIERQVALHAGLGIAGNAFRGVGIPQCILSGQRAAERVISSM